MSEKFNEYCKSCILFLLQDKYGCKECNGVEEYSAETTGCMHCYQPTTGNEIDDKIKILVNHISGFESKIKNLKYRKKESEKELKELKRSN